MIKHIRNQQENKKSPSAKRQRAEKSRLPLLETLRTFKEDMAIENIRLIS